MCFCGEVLGRASHRGEMFSEDFSIADLGMQVVWVGDSGGWLAPNHWVFSKNWLSLLVNLFNRQELADG